DDEPGPVFVMNESLVRRHFAGQDPIGLRIRLPWINDNSFAPVIGVVADLRYAKLGTPIEPELFTDYRHGNPYGMTLVMRTAVDPHARRNHRGDGHSGGRRRRPRVDAGDGQPVVRGLGHRPADVLDRDGRTYGGVPGRSCRAGDQGLARHADDGVARRLSFFA